MPEREFGKFTRFRLIPARAFIPDNKEETGDCEDEAEVDAENDGVKEDGVFELLSFERVEYLPSLGCPLFFGFLGASSSSSSTCGWKSGSKESRADSWVVPTFIMDSIVLFFATIVRAFFTGADDFTEVDFVDIEIIDEETIKVEPKRMNNLL